MVKIRNATGLVSEGVELKFEVKGQQDLEVLHNASRHTDGCDLRGIAAVTL